MALAQLTTERQNTSSSGLGQGVWFWQVVERALEQLPGRSAQEGQAKQDGDTRTAQALLRPHSADRNS